VPFINHRLLYGALGMVMAGGLVLAPAMSAYAAYSDIWTGEQITVTFKLPPSTNLNWTPQAGEPGVIVSEIHNMGQGLTSGLATISNVDLISATPNTFRVRFTVPAPEYGVMWSDVYFSLSLPIPGTTALAFGGNSTTDYTYVSPPPAGQLPEVPVASALPVIGLLAYGGMWAKQRYGQRTMPPRDMA
jgi:hypothetical protein